MSFQIKVRCLSICYPAKKLTVMNSKHSIYSRLSSVFPFLPAKQYSCKNDPSISLEEKILSEATINANVKHAEYAVRGTLALESERLNQVIKLY
jgi:hypothetical protein